METNCERITSKTLITEPKQPLSTDEVNNCKLTGGYSVGLLEYAEHLYHFKTELVTNIWAHDFRNAYKYSIDLFAGRYILREVDEIVVSPTMSIGTST